MARASALLCGWQDARTIAKDARIRRRGTSREGNPSARRRTITSSPKSQSHIFKGLHSLAATLCSAGEVTALAKEIKEKLPGKDIWLYTGFTIEQIEANDKLKQILPYVDVIVDGEYVKALRDVTLAFRGSRNQRIISIKNEKTVKM